MHNHQNATCSDTKNKNIAQQKNYTTFTTESVTLRYDCDEMCCRYARVSWSQTSVPDESDFDMFINLFRVSRLRIH